MDYGQFKGKPFQVVSKLGVRYTGIFDHISQEDQTICLSQVFNHGTEDRPSARKLPGSTSSLGWVRFHTESIDSLALVETNTAPGTAEEPVDPILASVSQSAPSSNPPQPTATPPSGPSALPSKPPPSTNPTNLERVQQSLADLSVTNSNSNGNGYRQSFSGNGNGNGKPRRTSKAQAIEVPDAEFDFSKGTQALQAEREARRAGPSASRRQSNVTDEDDEEEDEEEDDEEVVTNPHPIAIQKAPTNGGGGLGERPPRDNSQSAYNKNSFFDQLSTGTSKVSIAEERGRNYDTFGEAGGAEYNPGNGGYRGRGGYGGGGEGRGGYEGGGGYGGRGGFGNRGRGGYEGGENRAWSQGGPPQGYRGEAVSMRGGWGGHGNNNGYGGGRGDRGGYGGRGGGRGGRPMGGFDASKTGSFEPGYNQQHGGQQGQGQAQGFRGRGRGGGGWN